MEIIYKIKAIRDSKGLSLGALANMSGVSKAQINDIERGKKHPTLPTLIYIANALEVNPGDLYEIRYSER